MQKFNLVGQIDSELKEFFTKKIKIASANVDGREVGGYEYSQWETLQAIEFIDGSKFLSGDRDSEGQQKFYLNMATFRRETASKNIDIDVANFKFIPEDGSAEYGSIIAKKKFRKWVKDSKLSYELNSSADNFPKYGTLVFKRVGKQIKEVSLLKLRNSQGAKSLDKADYVIEEHSMTVSEMSEFPDWDTSNLDAEWNEKLQVYERYGNLPLSFYKKVKGEKVEDEDDDKVIYCVAVVVKTNTKTDKEKGNILFLEETECPYVEVHYEKVQDRWLGRGEMEKQFENQAARNMVFNLRKKGLAWSVKNIFQTQDDTIVNNLVREVKDGDILKVSTPNGIYRVDTVSRASGDFNSIDQLVEENANQRSFTFEAATGEAFKSGTPFRLGALLSDSVNSYYSKKKEQLGIFWKDLIFNYWIPTWEKETEEEFIVGVCDTDEGYEDIRRAKKDLIKRKIIVKALTMGKAYDPMAAEMLADMLMKTTKTDYYKMTREELKNLKYTFDIDITGESIDIPQKMETLTTLYQSLIREGDIETARSVRNRILTLANEKIPSTPVQAPNMAMQGMGNTPTNE